MRLLDVDIRGPNTSLVTVPGPTFAGSPRNALLQANFTADASGSSVDAYVQTTIDAGATWMDIANFHFTTTSAIKYANLSSFTPVTTEGTPTSGGMTANAVQDGVLGPAFRIQYKSAGTYNTAHIRIDLQGVDIPFGATAA